MARLADHGQERFKHCVYLRFRAIRYWQPEAKTLHSSGVGNWWKETSLAPGTYEYCLVVDGKWMPDPLAKESVPTRLAAAIRF